MRTCTWIIPVLLALIDLPAPAAGQMSSPPLPSGQLSLAGIGTVYVAIDDRRSESERIGLAREPNALKSAVEERLQRSDVPVAWWLPDGPMLYVQIAARNRDNTPYDVIIIRLDLLQDVVINATR